MRRWCKTLPPVPRSLRSTCQASQIDLHARPCRYVASLTTGKTLTEDEFLALSLRNPINRTILERLPALALNDAWLVSGALFQTVWNVRAGYAPDRGIKDYDIFYFDADTSWEAEDAAIRRVHAAFADLGVDTELRNQARAHLWYEGKFGAPYPALSRATDGIDRFLMHSAQVGVHRRAESYDVYAPHGFDDIANMVVRPNFTPNFQTARFMEKATRWKALWPELTIL